MKRLALIGPAIVLTALLSCILWLELRDPITSLPAPERLSQPQREPLPAYEPHRHIEHLDFHTDRLGAIGIAVSLPDPLPAEKLPVLIVLGGLGSGEDNIRYVTGAGNNAIIGFDWPMPVHFYRGAGFVAQIPDLYRRLMTVPGQIASAIEWLAQQDWADKQRVSILGFSLGALAVPSAEDLLEHNGHKIGWTIIAYGGAPFGTLFLANPHITTGFLRLVLAPFIDFLLQPLQPTQHLPHLSGQFLVLEGRDDSLIPAAARDTLRNAVPEPKTVIVFEGNHMGVGADKMALLQKIIAASRAWLIEKGAVNRR